MNEVQLLAAQLKSERTHLRAVAALCAAARHAPETEPISDDLSNSCVQYLLFILSKERARIAAQRTASGATQVPQPVRAALEAVTAIAQLVPGLEARASAKRLGASQLAEMAAALEALVDARAALTKQVAPTSSPETWRMLAQLDADDILEERRLHTQVLRHSSRLRE